MTDAVVSQVTTEVLTLGSSSNLEISQLTSEALTQNQGAALEVSQVIVEVLRLNGTYVDKPRTIYISSQTGV